ncbi:MAG: cell wall metabolism sensor histidine kinase WalK [Defluviitaleaceae bacterium]|nr:cell wall metabolism sensor histidine kinase WalK [Defluviitaleaceae bacterium]
MNSIRIKWVVLFLALVFIVMIISGTFMLIRTNIQETEMAHIQLTSFALQIQEQVIEVMSPDNFQEAFATDAALRGGALRGRSNEIQGNIINSAGQTIASTVANDPRQLVYKDTSIVSAFAGERAFSRGKAIDVTGQFIEFINYAKPVFYENSEDVLFVIFTRIDAEPIRETLLDLGRTLLFTVFIALALTGILGYLFATTITSPIILLAKKAKEFALNKIDQPLVVNSTDEIGQLTDNFNNMSKELSKNIADLESAKNKTETLLHNMTDGVLAYNRLGELIHANNVCGELLKLDNIENIPFSEMMKNINAEITNVEEIEADYFETSPVAIGDRFVSAKLTPYVNQQNRVDGIVILLRDITQHKKLDDMRKEFVANVSHEIRTPITSIKSYAETLLDGVMFDHKTSKEFLEVIDSEADRMTLLVKDLLDLSQFDNNQLQLNPEETDLSSLVALCIKQSYVLASKKSQKFVFDDVPKGYIVNVDPARINQVMTNLINNAIKYGSDGCTIKIETAETSKYYLVSITDQGPGISKDDLPHIFDRFYRVDKARARAMGGTGLGLAISKEIMEAHDGKIFAESTLGVGTTMTLQFPKE